MGKEKEIVFSSAFWGVIFLDPSIAGQRQSEGMTAKPPLRESYLWARETTQHQEKKEWVKLGKKGNDWGLEKSGEVVLEKKKDITQLFG